MKSAKPLILIPSSVQDLERKRFALAQTYVKAVLAAGGIPILAPVTMPTDDMRAVYDQCNGVLLTGGSDCDPADFGEERHEKTSGIDHDRDRAEYALVKWAIQEDKPIFGICRGEQVMNVAMGGSLIQDIPSQWQTDATHAWQGARNDLAHTVSVDANTRLAGMTGAGEIHTNSFHHQSVKKLGDGFKVSARAADGVIEGIENPTRAFAVGVQWHPEDLAPERDEAAALFKEFVNACKNSAR